jgi:hypothetical protein
LRGKAPEAINNKHILIENALYYISDVNGDPMVRLYIPSHIKPEYKSIKPIIYLFPDRVVGYGPLTSTPM